MQKLREWMKKSGTTQMALAKTMGVRQGAISGWLIGRTEPGFKKLLKLSKVTGLSIDELIRG